MDTNYDGPYSFDFEEIVLIPFYGLRCIVLGNEQFLNSMKDCSGEYTVYLSSDKGLNQSNLIGTCLRMRPDCLIVSEEVYHFNRDDVIMAANTGHEVMIVGGL
jgi:hypothetical protein